MSLITEADAAALRGVAEVEFVSEMVTSQQQVISSQSNWRTTILGVNVDYQNIKSWPTKSEVLPSRTGSSGNRTRGCWK